MAGPNHNPNGDLLREFVVELRATLDQLELLVTGSEEGRCADGEALATLFRGLNALQAAQFIGLIHTATLARAAESLLDLYRNGAAVHIHLLCRTLDTFRAVVLLIEAEFTDVGRVAECTALTFALDQAGASVRSEGSARGAGPTAVAADHATQAAGQVVQHDVSSVKSAERTHAGPLKLRRRRYPIVKLSELHGVNTVGASAVEGILVIGESGDRLACILVDEVVGQRRTVIKPLDEYLKRVRGLSGCSILHNRDISSILDVEGVVGAAESRAA